VRELKKELYAYKPQRAELATLPEIQAMITQTDSDEIRALIGLMWSSAARLTSITSLRKSDVLIASGTDEPSLQSAIMTMTFRQGKTILATRPYTIHVDVPIQVARAVQVLKTRTMEEHGKLFKKKPDTYYKELRPTLQRFLLTIRSLRRGALATLAMANVPPEQLLLLSRHKSKEGLYTYLDDGLYAFWEGQQTLQLSNKLWHARR
jgi:integrase